VAKVYSEELDLEFFTTIYKSSNLVGKMVRLKLFPSKEIGFGDYLGRFYIRCIHRWGFQKSDAQIPSAE